MIKIVKSYHYNNTTVTTIGFLKSIVFLIKKSQTLFLMEASSQKNREYKKTFSDMHTMFGYAYNVWAILI